MNSFVVANPNKCIGCRTCEIACALAHTRENSLTGDTHQIEFNPRLNVIKTANISAPIQCRHCEDAPCAAVCPVGAIVNRNNTIQVDAEICIGCKTCLMACPIGAIDLAPKYINGEKKLQQSLKCIEHVKVYNKEKIVANKCDLCINRPEGPACAEVCPTAVFRIVRPEIMSDSIKNKRKASVAELAHLSINR